ncbi:MAG: hypothetical protein ACLGI6_18830, partial [Gammaproteobacteria bacterium]
AMPAPEAEFEALRTRARAHLAAFDTAARRHGADSVEQRVLDEDTRAALLMESRYADLVVTSQEPLANPIRAWAEGSALPAYLALHSGRPVLVVPQRAVEQRKGASG